MIIRFLKDNEINKLKYLLHNHYRKDHILSQNKEVINFYYNFKKKKKINFLGTFKKKKLLSVLGLIPLQNWDPRLKKDFFMAMMMKSKYYKGHITFDYLEYIYKQIKPNFLAACGFNLNTEKIYQRLGKVYSYEHYYIYNPKLSPKISKNLYSNISKIKKLNNLKLVISKRFNHFPKSNNLPFKSKKYFINKYLKNPFYDYFILKFYNKDEIKFFFICREIYLEKFKAKIYRIVDFYGEIKNHHVVYKEVYNLLIKNKIEYIDIKCLGIEKKKLINLGFLEKKRNQVIPDFFEPFLKENDNTKICILKNNYKKNFFIFKGDGDQDRPNKI